MNSLTKHVDLVELMRAQGRVLTALILRDIKTRFFGTSWGFLLAICWPLSHAFAVVAINSLAGRSAPYGDSAVLWFASGTVPFMAFSYMSRFIMLGIILNKALLAFPVVKVTDILFARAILELLSASCVVILTMVILYFMDIDFVPNDLTQACLAMATSMMLGFGFGILNAIIAAAVPGWITGFALLQIVMWIASGVAFNIDGMPEVARYWLSFNPVLQGIEWLRSSYYDGVGEGVLDRPYMVGFALVTIILSLGLERLVRGKILS